MDDTYTWTLTPKNQCLGHSAVFYACNSLVQSSLLYMYGLVTRTAVTIPVLQSLCMGLQLLHTVLYRTASLHLLHVRLQSNNAGGCVQTLEEYCGKYKEEGEEFKTLINGVLPDGWADELPTFTPEDKPLATRLHSQTMLNALAPTLPGFWGGSAGKLPHPPWFGVCQP